MKIRSMLMTCLTIGAAALSAGCQDGSTNGTGTPFNWLPSGQAPAQVGQGLYPKNAPRKVQQKAPAQQPKKKGHWEMRTKTDCNGKPKHYRVWVQDSMLLPSDNPGAKLPLSPLVDLVAYGDENGSDEATVPFTSILPQMPDQGQETILAWGGGGGDSGGDHGPCD